VRVGQRIGNGEVGVILAASDVTVFAEPIALIANWVVGVAPKSSHKR